MQERKEEMHTLYSQILTEIIHWNLGKEDADDSYNKLHSRVASAVPENTKWYELRKAAKWLKVLTLFFECYHVTC